MIELPAEVDVGRRRAAPLPPAERRAALIAATLPLLREYGGEVSTRQIAEAAGVAEGTIFRVFPDKAALIAAAVDAAFDPDAVAAELVDVDLGLPLRERLIEAVEIVRARVVDMVALMTALHGHRNGQHNGRQNGQPDERPDAHAGQHRPRRPNTAVDRAVARLLAPDRARLRVPPVDVVRVLRSLVMANAVPWLHDGKPLTSAQIVDVVLDGVRRHGGDAPC